MQMVCGISRSTNLSAAIPLDGTTGQGSAPSTDDQTGCAWPVVIATAANLTTKQPAERSTKNCSGGARRTAPRMTIFASRIAVVILVILLCLVVVIPRPILIAPVFSPVALIIIVIPLISATAIMSVRQSRYRCKTCQGHAGDGCYIEKSLDHGWSPLWLSLVGLCRDMSFHME